MFGLKTIFKYHSFIILENIMENTGTVHRWQTTPSPGAITMAEVNLKRTFSSGEWEKRVAIEDNVIIVEKVGIWPMCALLNIKLQQKRTKRMREKLYKLLTSLIQPYNLFLLTCYFY